MFYHSITVDTCMSNAMKFPEIGSFIGKWNSFLISEKVRYGFFNICYGFLFQNEERCDESCWKAAPGKPHRHIPDTTCSICQKQCGSYAGHRIGLQINRLHAELMQIWIVYRVTSNSSTNCSWYNGLWMRRYCMEMGLHIAWNMKFSKPYVKASGINKYALAYFEREAKTKFFISPSYNN